MIDISDAVMYINYFKKNLYLSFLKKYKKLDFTGRIEDKNPELRGYEGCYPINSILRKLKPTKNDRILDIGCGKNYFYTMLQNFNLEKSMVLSIPLN